MFIKIDRLNRIIEQQFLLIETMLFTQYVACDMNATVIIINFLIFCLTHFDAPTNYHIGQSTFQNFKFFENLFEFRDR